MPYDIRNVGGKDAVIEQMAKHLTAVDTARAMTDRSRPEAMNYRRKGKKLNVLQSSARRGYCGQAAVGDKQRNIDIVYERVSRVKKSVDDQNDHAFALSERLRRNRTAKKKQSEGSLTVDTLHLANRVSDLKEFWLPVRGDFRGRMYCANHLLNSQGMRLL